MKLQSGRRGLLAASLCAGLLLLHPGNALAQRKWPAQPGGNLHAGDVLPPPEWAAQPGVVRNRAFAAGASDEAENEEDKSATAEDPAGREVLEFTDGARLHGLLDRLDTARHQILWRRDDASEPIAFSTSDVSRLLVEKRTAPKNGRATVKLAGSNWFTGDLTEIRDGKVLFALSGGVPISVERARIEWIYFSETVPVECYDGPTSSAGWAIGAGWSFHNGALRASTPNIVSYKFDALPDKVDYEIELDQGMVEPAFKLVLHSRGGETSSQSSGAVEFLFMGNSLQMVAGVDNTMQVQQRQMPDDEFGYHSMYDPSAAESHTKARPFRVRLLEDRPAGRMVIYMNGRRAADWPIGKAKTGANGGGLGIQPLGWSSGSEQLVPAVGVLPWDGQIPPDASPADRTDRPDDRATDEIVFADGAIEHGSIHTIDSSSVSLDGSHRSEFPRANVILLRLKRASDPLEENAPAARVHLASKGEVDVDSLAFKDGKFVLQTSFAGELSLAPDCIQSIDLALAHPAGEIPKPEDELIFRNGDRLRGALQSAGDGRKLRWRIAKSGAMADFDTNRIAGILLASETATAEQPPEVADAKAAAIVRFRNGDLLAGGSLRLDSQHLAMETLHAGPLTLPRAEVRTIYFSENGKPRILDAASNPQQCLGGADPGTPVANGKPGGSAGKHAAEAWRYFNGSFTLQAVAHGNGFLRLGQTFDSMPNDLEIDFDVSTPKSAVMIAAQLFMGDQTAGYFLQIAPTGLYIYDMQPRQRMGRVAQQQFEFPPSLKNSDRERHFRLFANRYSGKLSVFVDGMLIGHFNAKTNAPPRKLEGHTIQLMPQSGSACTFSNLWIGPWNGQLPGSPLASGELDKDTVLLANGDSSRGAIQSIGEKSVALDCELGKVDFPVERAAMVQFGGTPTLHPMRAASSLRLRFAGLGLLSGKAYEIKDGAITFDSELAGTIKLPLSTLRELVFDAGPSNSLPESQPAPAASPSEKPDRAAPAKKPLGRVY